MTKHKKFFSILIKSLKHTCFFASSDINNQGNEEDLEKIATEEQKLFTLEKLVYATKNFDEKNKLGEGGFGPVYKGKLADGRLIAVKKLARSSNQGKTEFMNEAKLLARVQHRNVVNLLGYCIHGEEKLLVYEYLPHQSLDKLLFNNNTKRREVLDWKKRFEVIVGVARGLLYLHEDSHICIIHRDIKPSNILIDDKWAPKIADFGMARLFPEGQTHVNTRVAGTNGYMAPEYLMHGQLSEKADVFSFGVVVLEIISGQHNSTFIPDTEAQGLLEWVWKLYKKGRFLEIMDASLAPGVPAEEIAMCIKIGLLCIQADPKLRPRMRRVVVMLSKKSAITDEITKPGYPGCRFRRGHHTSADSPRTATSAVKAVASTSTASSSDKSFSTSYYSSTPAFSITNPTTSEPDRGKRPVQS